jgi:hypothetical protein
VPPAAKPAPPAAKPAEDGEKKTEELLCMHVLFGMTPEMQWLICFHET